MSKKLIIFDIDGTLLYSNKIDSQCFATVFQKIYNKEFPTIDWSKFPHVTDDTIFRTAIQQLFDRAATEEEMEFFKDKFVAMLRSERAQRPEEFKEVPSAKQTIERLLADDGYEVGIATGGWQRPALLKLAFIGIPTQDLRMSFADGNPTREDIITGVLNHAALVGQEFERVVYVGDAPWDVRTTRNMNMNFIGIRRKGDHESLQQLGAKSVMTDYSDWQLFEKTIETCVPPKNT